MRFTTTRLLPPISPGSYEVTEGMGALVFHRPDGTQFCVQALEVGKPFLILPGLPLGVYRFTTEFTVTPAKPVDPLPWAIERIGELERLCRHKDPYRQRRMRELHAKGLRKVQIGILLNVSREAVCHYLGELHA